MKQISLSAALILALVLGLGNAAKASSLISVISTIKHVCEDETSIVTRWRYKLYNYRNACPGSPTTHGQTCQRLKQELDALKQLMWFCKALNANINSLETGNEGSNEYASPMSPDSLETGNEGSNDYLSPMSGEL